MSIAIVSMNVQEGTGVNVEIRMCQSFAEKLGASILFYRCKFSGGVLRYRKDFITLLVLLPLS